MKNHNLKHPKSKVRPGYEYLACYQLGLVIQELTEKFCQVFLVPKNPKTHNPEFRQIQQMVQAARSNPQNIAEGSTQESLKSYIYLSGIARGSNEELGKDYIGFLKKNNLSIWGKDEPNVREFREFRVRWLSQNTLNTPMLSKNPEVAANMIITLCQMEGYLLHKLIKSLRYKHKTDGGLTENLYKERTSYRGY